MLTKKQLVGLFELLNKELAKEDIKGELYLVGGAVMCLAFAIRPSTRDVDAYFVPAAKIRSIAQQIASNQGLDESWLNDGVKAYLSPQGVYEPYLALSHLKIFCASAEYLLAMKCLAMRIGEEFHDIGDVEYLLRNLGITRYEKAIEIISKYYPAEKFPAKSALCSRRTAKELTASISLE